MGRKGFLVRLGIKGVLKSIAAISLVACAGNEVAQVKTIHIVSEPPGARIEVNNEYVGDAPRDIQVRCDDEGRFYENTRIRATPIGEGYTQTKYFRGVANVRKAWARANWGIPNPLIQSDPIPSRVFLDTHLKPIPSEIDVRVNN
jgi:hypothetical protein